MNGSDFEELLDALTTKLVLPLQVEKRLVTEALEGLCGLVAQQRDAGFFGDAIDVRLAGKLWFVFYAMLTEADYAKDPGPILDGAWQYQDELRRAFGPTWP